MTVTCEQGSNYYFTNDEIGFLYNLLRTTDRGYGEYAKAHEAIEAKLWSYLSFKGDFASWGVGSH